MADALVSPVVAGVAGVVSGALLVIAAKKVKKNQTDNLVPLMGVMGAFVFAAQMINFSIPGTGSSGHIVGGVLLASMLGPWGALITLASVLVIQCLVFADGGLMALGCNIFNMGVCTCVVAYPLVFRPLMKYPASLPRVIAVSVVTCVVGLELGAVAVTLETAASGITALPIGQFLLFMLPIHLAIGIGEGFATAAVLYFVQSYKPELLVPVRRTGYASGRNIGFSRAVSVFAVLALVLGISFSWVASSDPDGLEWSVAHLVGDTEPAVEHPARAYEVSRDIQQTTAWMPGYNTTFAGVIGGVLVVLVTWGVTGLLQYRRKALPEQNE